MMLTMNQPIPYGYRPIHDLPTPPRSSPPVTILDTSQKALQQQQQQQSPPTKPMSAPHRGLPLPAAMTLAQPPPPHGPPHPPAPGSVMQAQAPPVPSPHSQSLGPLPPPPQWQGSEDSMRSWLLAKAEEERRKQEEERTRQESLRLEQRRIEHDILRTSLERGIPPSMIPVVFAGLSGGHLSQATLEWVQQFLPLPQHAQILPAQGPMSPGLRRDSQQYGSYAGSAGVPPTPGSAAGTQAGFVPYQGPGSPTRARAHTISGLGSAAGRSLGGLGSSALPRLSTGEGISGPSHPSHTATQQQQQQQQPPPPPQQQPQQQQQGPVAQPETQSPGIYFHYWQPPTSNVSASQQAASSVDSPKKRKATGPQQSVPPPGQRRSRSPTFGPQASTSVLSNPPPGRRRGHSRQRSDISAYRSTGRNRGESFGPHGGFSPGVGAPIVGTSRETTFAEPYQQQPPRGSHSVSSMLSDQPSSSRFPPDVRPPGQQLEGEQRSRAASEERGRGTHPPPPPPPPSASRERASD
ncbi:hypothetical protein EV127DRAFT_508950 [Xylaria flabelliformis]|nr:hypothetical protein EV127DRAFT_508950 [Xylaria flabelliformis]